MRTTILTRFTRDANSTHCLAYFHLVPQVSELPSGRNPAQIFWAWYAADAKCSGSARGDDSVFQVQLPYVFEVAGRRRGMHLHAQVRGPAAVAELQPPMPVGNGVGAGEPYGEDAGEPHVEVRGRDLGAEPVAD